MGLSLSTKVDVFGHTVADSSVVFFLGGLSRGGSVVVCGDGAMVFRFCRVLVFITRVFSREKYNGDEIDLVSGFDMSKRWSPGSRDASTHTHASTHAQAIHL